MIPKFVDARRDAAWPTGRHVVGLEGFLDVLIRSGSLRDIAPKLRV